MNGQAYTLIHSMVDLAAITPLLFDANGNPVYDPNSELQAYGPGGTGYYALAQNLDASGKTYNGPIISTLTGTLAGLGHTISHLKLNTTANVFQQYADGALIDQIGTSGTVRDLGLTKVSTNPHGVVRLEC